MATGPDSLVHFDCNICGAANAAPINQRHRELLHCGGCSSCARFRGIVKAIIKIVPDMRGDAPLVARDPQKHIRGIGMSDSDAYAAHFSRLFDYTNTYYHTDPLLDVTDRASASQYSDLDFVVSSDVLEHVKAPVSEALANICAMLRPGGHLILTVPYLDGYETIEHFPHLNDFKIVGVGGDYVLINERRNGSVEMHRDLSFHGGPGSVLEMRIFGEGDLMAMLRYAGFGEIEAMTPDDDRSGYSWDDAVESNVAGNRRNKSYVLICRKPVAERASIGSSLARLIGR